MSRLTGLILVFAFFLAFLVPAPANGADGLAAAVAWLRTQQQEGGGFSNGFAPESDVAATADAVVAIVSAGEAPTQWTSGGASPLDFLEQRALEVTTPGLAAKVALAAIAAGEDPSAFGGVDLLGVIAAGFDPATGFYGAGPFDSALCLLALEHADAGAPQEAIQALLRARQPDGSYAFDGAMTPGSGDSNTTALVVQALLIAGAGGETVASYDYFRRTQNPDGGWTYQKPSPFGEETDANSTALVIQALLAGGQDLAAWNDPLAALTGLQQPSGALAYNAGTPGDNFLATVQAIPALAGVDLTDLSRLASAPQAATSSRGILAGAALILVLVLLVALVISQSESARRAQQS